MGVDISRDSGRTWTEDFAALGGAGFPLSLGPLGPPASYIGVLANQFVTTHDDGKTWTVKPFP
jgi:photosystem II stability/assembly factor-like uncharacterized protein